MRHRGRSQPRIADRHLRKLYWIAKRQRVKLTQLLNLIIATAIEDLAQAPDLSDGGHITSATGHSRARQRHPERGFHHGTIDDGQEDSNDIAITTVEEEP